MRIRCYVFKNPLEILCSGRHIEVSLVIALWCPPGVVSIMVGPVSYLVSGWWQSMAIMLGWHSRGATRPAGALTLMNDCSTGRGQEYRLLATSVLVFQIRLPQSLGKTGNEEE